MKISATKSRTLRTLLAVEEAERRRIGQRIAQARKEAGFRNQQELGDRMGFTMRAVQTWEAGEVVPWKHFRDLERILEKPRGWFTEDDRDDAVDQPAGRMDAVLAEMQQIREGQRELVEAIEQLRRALADRGDEPA